MIPLPSGWVEFYAPRPKLGEWAASYAWCDGDTQTITYYWGWWLIGLYFLKLHERWHATTRVFRDCGRNDCLMSREKGLKVWRAILMRRVKTGDWFCPECWAGL